MASVVIAQLARFGPQKCEQLSYDQAASYTRSLAGGHYENFSVVSWLVPRHLRSDFANVYAFCRWADDLGDEAGNPAEATRLLGWWKRELIDCYRDKPRHPVFVALHRTVRNHDIPIHPFADLIDAFEQDQRINRYQTWKQLLDYCTRSADPVGRLVLYLCGYRDAERQKLSDSTCTALQLVNFWQDVRRDIEERDRIYIPAQDLAQAGLTHDDLTRHVEDVKRLSNDQLQACSDVVRSLVERTAPLFVEGRKLWPRVHHEVRLPIQLFTLGGQAVMRRIAKTGYHTIQTRPRIGKGTKAMLMLRVLLGRTAGLFRGGRR